jgi:hypothetical protein
VDANEQSGTAVRPGATSKLANYPRAASVRVAVPFGRMEGRPRLSDDEHEELLARNRARYCASDGEAPAMRPKTRAAAGFAETSPGLL